jgi:thiamine biosynthesis lipoprotein ApbE
MKGYIKLLFGVLVFFLCSCSDTKKDGVLKGREYTGSVLGKQYKIEVIGDSTNYQSEIDMILNQINGQFNLSDTNSTLYKINFSKVINKPISIQDPGRYFVRFFHLMEEMHEQSAGKFDPTAVTFERIIAYGGSDPEFIPNFDEFENAVGFGKETLELLEVGTDVSVIKHDPYVEWDVTDAAACWAMDLVLDRLKEHGFSAMKAVMSGKYLLQGEGPGDFNVVPMGFTGQMEDPQIRLKNRALCYKNAQNKKVYVDLATKKSVDNDFQWVSVSAPSMLESEVFSKAFMCMDIESVADWYSQHGQSDIQSSIIYGYKDKMDRATTQEFDNMIVVKP